MSIRTRLPRGVSATILLTIALIVPVASTGCGPRATTGEPQSSQATTAPPAAAQNTTQPATLPASDPETVAPKPTTPPAENTAPVVVYFVRDEYLGIGARDVPASAPAHAALEQLLAGPKTAEKASGLVTAIPSGTKLHGVTISKGVATVDLSRRFESGGGTLSMSLRIGQVVQTLGQFPGVRRVAFKLDGEKVRWISGEGIVVSPPVKPSSYDDLLPPILLESPAPGARITSPVRIQGTADVFEGTFRVRITDAAGKVVKDRQVKATSGTGTRGTFDASVNFVAGEHGLGWLTVYEPSAKDGSPTNVVKIRVRL